MKEGGTGALSYSARTFGALFRRMMSLPVSILERYSYERTEEFTAMHAARVRHQGGSLAFNVHDHWLSSCVRRHHGNYFSLTRVHVIP